MYGFCDVLMLVTVGSSWSLDCCS